MIHAANTVTYNMANDDESFNKEMVSDSLEWYVTLSPNKKNGDVFWPAGICKSVGCILVILRPKVGTLIAAFFADMMFELSCPFSEKAPVEADLSLCTSPPNLIACNVLMTFV
jgi:hypothetical protein